MKNLLIDYQTERVILSKILSSPLPDYEMLDLVKMEYFAYPQHLELYASYIECVNQWKCYDRLLLHQIIKDQNAENAEELIKYLEGLTSDKLELSYSQRATKHLKDLWIRRTAKSKMEQLLSALEDTTYPMTEWLDTLHRANANLMDVIDSSEEQTFTRPSDFSLSDFLKNTDFEFLSTGIEELDDCIGGFKNEMVYIVASRPDVDKLDLLLRFALQVSKEHTALFFSMHDHVENIGQRIVLNHKEDSNTHSALLINDQSEWDIDSFCDFCLIKYNIKNYRIIFIDYLQLFSSLIGGYRNDQMSYITKRLKTLARKLKIPIVLTAALNRQPNTRLDNPKPMLFDLRESSSIEENADVVMLLNAEEDGQIHLHVAKNAFGQLGQMLIS